MVTSSPIFNTSPTGTNSDLAKLICNPDIALNDAKMSLNLPIWVGKASQKIRVSSAKWRWVTIKGVWDLGPTVNPKIWPARTAPSNSQLKASITITNKSRDNGPPWRNPLQLPKKSLGLPLIKMENFTVEMQNKIYFLHCSKNPHRYSIYMRKSQLKWSNAFSTSSWEFYHIDTCKTEQIGLKP